MSIQINIFIRKLYSANRCSSITVYRSRITKNIFTGYMLYVIGYIQITRYSFTRYRLQVTYYRLQGTSLQITKDTRFSLVSRFHQMVAVLHWTEHRNAPTKIPSQNGRPSLQLQHLWYMLKTTVLQVASWSLQLTFCRLYVVFFVLNVSSSKTHSIRQHF
jgi:hypothetical protein